MPLLIAAIAIVVVALVAGGAFIARFVLTDRDPTGDTAATEPADPAGGSVPDELSGRLEGQGTGGAIDAMQMWAGEVTAQNPDLQIVFNPTGSGAGIDSLMTGATAFAIADRPVSDAEYGTGGACALPPLSLPITATPIAIIAQVPGVTAVVLDAATLAEIYQGTITNWSDPAIAALNPDQTFPDLAITPIHRGDDSGTSLVLSTWLHQVKAWNLEPHEDWPADAGKAADGTRGMNDAVVTTVGAIGYVGLSGLPTDVTVAQLVQQGEAYAPDGPAATYQIDGSPKVPGRSVLDEARQLDTTIGGAYPLLQVNYLIVCEQYTDAEQGRLVSEVFGWVLAPEGHRMAVPIGTQPFSAPMYEALANAMAAIS